MIEPGIGREKLQRPEVGRGRAKLKLCSLLARPAASTFLAAGPTLPRTLAPIKLQLISSRPATRTRHVHASTASLTWHTVREEAIVVIQPYFRPLFTSARNKASLT